MTAMVTPAPRQRLSRLVNLASQKDVPLGELSGELADLLLDWPSNYPTAMREPFETLLEKSLRDVDPAARALLARRFTDGGSLPLSVLNTLIFDASSEVRQQILARNADLAGPLSFALAESEQELLAAARNGPADLSSVLAWHFAITREIAGRIVADPSAWTLAILCKGTNCGRATFSALAVLARPRATSDENYRRLAAFDQVDSTAAQALLGFWRGEVPHSRAPTTIV